MIPERYDHTQPGTLTRVVLGGAAGLDFIALAYLAVRFDRVGFLVVCALLLVFLVCLLLFHSLTVTVDDEALEIRFGPGLIRKKFPLGELVSCEVVRNSWLHGWGIHRTWHGWVYNVSGFDAVEIVLKNGRKDRIGTDAPQELAAALKERIRAWGGRKS